MKCQKCLFENPPDAKFCIECGNPIDFLCPRCNAVTPHTGKFCMACGCSLTEPKHATSIDYSVPRSYTPKNLVDKILTTRSSVEGERKLVTVFFADVVNSTAIAERLELEEFQQIMDGTFRTIMDEIHNVEGTISRFTGDGVMALFGAPLAHEDHAQRACHAALCIQNAIQSHSRKINDRYGVDFSLRIGLNSGPVIVESIGDDLRMDYTALGDTANLAARMERLARPGTVLISKHTHRLVKEFFEFKSMGKIAVKGKVEPQEAFELITDSKVTRFEAYMVRGLTKFVGRESPMARLMELYEKAHSEAGQVVSIVGEAGVGKSRLLLEFRNLLPPDEVTYLEGQCLHYGGAMAYLPILDILKSYLEIKDGDQEPVIKKKLEEKTLHLHEKLRYDIAPLQELMSVEVDSQDFMELKPQDKRTTTFETLRDLFTLAGNKKTLVLAVEDLHWIDRTSEEFIDFLISFLPNSRILLILLYRPEYTHQWRNISYYTRIGLDQLSTVSSSQLIQAILAGGEVSPELNSLILGKAAGNPLFIEEFTHSLMENGSVEKHENRYVLNRRPSDIQVPDTIQGIIAARIDRLEDNIKRTMQVASVIGRDFAYRILHVITGMREELKSYLLNLQGLEFIYEKSLFPELEYIFKHALTQEVAYESLLLTRRKELHHRIGEAMESVYPDRLNEFSSIIGEHFLRGEAWERAFHYLDKAGDAAGRLYAHTEARLHYSRALEVLKRLEPTEANRRHRVDTIIKNASSSWRAMAPEQNLSLLTEAEEMAKSLSGPDGMSTSDTLRLARVHFWMGRVHYLSGEIGTAINYFQQVLPVAQTVDDPELVAIPSSAIGQAMEVLGFVGKARTLLGQAIPLLEKTGNWTEWIQAMGFLGTATAAMGDYAEGVSKSEHALARAKELNFVTGMSVSFNTLAFAHLFGADHAQAIVAARQAVKAAEESGDRIYRWVGYSLWGWAAGRAGQLKTAVACMERAQEAAQELGGRVIMADVFTAGRAEIAFYRGALDDALTLAQQAVKIAQEIGGIVGDGIGRRVWSQVLAAQPSPNWDEAEKQLAESLRVLASGSQHMEMARTHVVWGTLCRNRQKLSEAAEHWQQAASQFRTSGSIRELKEVRALMVDNGLAEPL